MGYPTKVQLIQRQKSAQWYVNFPSAVAAVLDFQKGEVVEWVVQDRNTLVLQRVAGGKAATQPPRKKKR
jgi:hypothetical protein